ncbi:MAG: hypothetical protein WCY75_01985 [Sulfurimonadaceae bacterium]
MQKIFVKNENSIIQKTIPNQDEILYSSIKWGKIESIFTPAFWFSQVLMHHAKKDTFIYKIGQNLEEEVVVCLLGGFGIKEELCLASFKALMQHKIIENIEKISIDDIKDILLNKVQLNNRHIKYRYYNKKSEYIYNALIKLKRDNLDISSFSDIQLRNYLTTFQGIGLKTASWIVRNYLNSDNVAILDIHIYRAGVLAGFFDINDSIEKNYLAMEEKFLKFAKAINVKASELDVLIWSKIRVLNHMVIELVNEKRKLIS